MFMLYRWWNDASQMQKAIEQWFHVGLSKWNLRILFSNLKFAATASEMVESRVTRQIKDHCQTNNQNNQYSVSISPLLIFSLKE